MKRFIAMMLLLFTLATVSCNGNGDDTSAQVTESGTSADTTSADTTSADTTEATPTDTLYYVRTPEQPPHEELQREVYTFESYEDACAKAQDHFLAATGYAVYSADGEFLYGVHDELVTTIMYNGKLVCDYIDMNEYTYGNAGINPAITYLKRTYPSEYGRPSREKLVSCDRLVDWILYLSGFTDQPETNGPHINGLDDPTYGSVGWCKAQGFERIDNQDDLQAGDIVFVFPKPNNPDFPQHVFLFAGDTERSKRGIFYRYDGGSDDRLRLEGSFASYSEVGQPTKDTVTGFMYAYRPVASALTNADTTAAE